MRRTTEEDKNRGIRWSLTTVLEDLDFADDIALLSSCQDHIREKTARLATCGAKLVLNINATKTKTLCINTPKRADICINRTAVEEVDEFTYLGSIVSRDSGTEDITSRLCMARQSSMLKPIWKSSVYSMRTKIKIYITPM